MPLLRDRAICLRRIEFSETSQILTLFGRTQGIVRVLAKGAHRRTKAGASKFDGGVDLLDVGDAVFTSSAHQQLGTLCEWSLREGHRTLRRSLRAIHLALYSAELIDALLEEHDPHEALFDRLEATLALLGSPRIEQAFLYFELDLLREAGYLPNWSICASCNVALSDRVYFSPQMSGLLCRSCEATAADRIEIDARLVRLVETLSRTRVTDPARLPQLTRHQTDPLNRVLAEHLKYVLNHPLRMQRYVLGKPAASKSRVVQSAK